MNIEASKIPLFLRQIFQHAEREYPRECCGLVVGASDSSEDLEVIPCSNIQDQCHRENPAQFPRTSSSAFFIDPKDLIAVQKKIRREKQRIRMIYHSHIEAPARFSAEDKKRALLEGEPLYPEIDYGVVSVVRKKAKDFKIFKWDSSKQDFISQKL